MTQGTIQRTVPRARAPAAFAARLGALAGTLAGIMVAAAPAGAATIEQTSLTVMTERAQVIFEGRVLSAATGAGKSGPTTCFTFQVDDYIKGDTGTGKLRLCFMGGKAGGYRLTISDLVYPAVGERGIYFVSSLDRPHANPLYGWSQGHFLVRQVKGFAATVTTEDGRDVVALAAGPVGAGPALSKGVAAGVRLSTSEQRTGAVAGAMTVADFKAGIRRLLSPAAK